MTRKKLKNGLVLTTVDLLIPILKYSRWLAVNYPQSANEDELVGLLGQSFKEIEEFARNEGFKQIKVATSPNWSQLGEVGLTRTTYCVTADAGRLGKPLKNYQIIKLKDPDKVKNLIIDQFVYHCQYKPIYFTCDISNSVNLFLKLVNERIKNDKGFLLGVKEKEKFVGFLYGEFEEDEGCIDELFVDEEFRGKRYGKSLVKASVAEFQRKSINKIGLFVGVDEESLGFYEKLGFKKEFVNWIKNLA